MASEKGKSAVSFTIFQNVIAGQLRGSRINHRGQNPSDRSQLWEVPVANAADLDDAVEAAQEAFRTWSKVAWESRQEYLDKLRSTLLERKTEMSDLIMIEVGKPVRRLLCR